MKKVIPFLLLCLLLFTACGSNVEEVNTDTINTISQKEVGDTVPFGNYNGKTLEWTVVYKGEGVYLLVANNIVDTQPFNAEGGSIEEDSPLIHANEWSECSLRNWLNKEFYNVTFSDSAKEAIVKCNLSNAEEAYQKNSDSTYDNVFILSYSECKEFLEPINSVDIDTEYWLRNSCGTNGLSALTCVGKLNLQPGTEQKQLVETPVGVRPAIWISDKDIEATSLNIGPATREGDHRLTLEDYDENNDGAIDDNELNDYAEDQMDLNGQYSDELRDTLEDE